ncbi:MAG: metal-dependent hydrolase [Polyangiaceae bacterium]
MAESECDIPRRPVELEFDASEVPRDWYDADLHITTFLDAFSILLPEGERFFVKSVRDTMGAVTDPALRERIAGFIGQEAVHARGHEVFNRFRGDEGTRAMQAIERDLKKLLIGARRTLPPTGRLAVTCALEHFTALFAESLLGPNAEFRDKMHPAVRALWLWHALEESEHKTVAYDVYEANDGGYAMRVSIMLLTTAIFFAALTYGRARILRARGGLFDVRGWLRVSRHLWLEPGFFRHIVPGYLSYFRPGFHPNDRDTSELVASWRERLFGEVGSMREHLARRAPSIADAVPA